MKDLTLTIMESELNTSESNILSWSKSDIREKAMSIVNLVADGLEDPETSYIRVKKGLEVLSEAEKNLKPYFDQAPYNKGEKRFGCEIVEKEMGVKYDYSACCDYEWNKLKSEIDKKQESLRERETFLKSLREPLNIVEFDGVISTIFPPIRTGKLGKQVTIK